MQDRSDYWQSCAEGGSTPLQTVAEINGTEYSASSAPVIKRGLFSDEPSIGNCTAASLEISILTDDEIPKSAEVNIRARYVGDETSEWLEMGTFYVSKRSKDYATGLLTLTCYDMMLVANQSYFDDDDNPTGVWPQAMSDTFDAIAGWMGIEIDSRTVINTGDAYMVPCPTGMTVLQVLGEIAAAHGGNFIITPQGKLRLVPLAEPGTADGWVDVTAILGSLTMAGEITISQVKLIGSDGNSYTAGDTTGYTLSVDSLPCASQELCDALYEQLGGMTYQPYTMSSAIYDPAAELGDNISYAGKLGSVLCYEEVTLNISHRAYASAPTVGELEDEYPYQSSTSKLEKAIAQVSASISSTVSSIVERTEESILATVSGKYVSTDSLATALEGTVISVKAYYAISDSADSYPDLDATDGISALTGYALTDVALVGYSSWTEEMPAYEDGDYVWLTYLTTHADGGTEWAEPALIVDGSLSNRIVSVSETAASIKILTDSILQSITATNTSWYTGGYIVAVTSTGTPDEAGCDAALYSGLYYLDQLTGYIYLSDGSAWMYADALTSTTEQMENTISQSITDSENAIKEYVAETYVTSDGVKNIVSASLVLQIVEAEDGTKYGTISANADYIELEAGKIIITGDNFSLDADGNAEFGGTLNSPNGKIGGFTIGTSAIYSKKTSLSDTTAGVYVGTDGIALGTNSAFKVTSGGVLTCSSATLTGTMTTTSGSYATKLTTGGLRFYYNDSLYGSFSSTTWNEKIGIAMHLTSESYFMSFSRDDDGDNVYTAAYYISYSSAISSYRHNFNDTANFSGAVTMSSTLSLESTLYMDNGKSICWEDSDGVSAPMMYLSSSDYLQIGNTTYCDNIYLRTAGRVRLLCNGSSTYYEIPQIYKGSMTITPSAANTPTSKTLTLSNGMAGTPEVFLTLGGDNPGTVILGTSVSGRSSTGFTCWVTRTNTSDTTVMYLMMY